MGSTIQAIATKANSPQNMVLVISEFWGKAYLLLVDSVTGDLNRGPIAVPMPALGAKSDLDQLRSALFFTESERILVAFAHDNRTF